MARRTIPDEFVPLHVHYRRDRAIRRAGNDAELMYLRSLALVRANRTAGRIEDFDLTDLGVGMDDPEAVAQTLVHHLLWVPDGDGWRIRSWEKWNQSKAAMSDGGTAGNHKRWHEERNIIEPSCPLCQTLESSPPIRGAIGGDSGTDSAGIAEENRREESRTATRGDSIARTNDDGTAQTLIAEWIEHCTTRPPGRVIGQVSKEIKSMLDEGQPYADVRNGLAAWALKGLHPSTLPSVVHEARTAKPARQARTLGEVDWEQVMASAVASEQKRVAS